MLNIRTLQILVEVARQGGFSRAAQTVHAVQPTVSKAVQAVEDRLGVRIFERANNGVRLTVEGEIVYRRALNILQEFEALSSRRRRPAQARKRRAPHWFSPGRQRHPVRGFCSPNTASFTPASTSRFRNRAAPRWLRWCFRGISILAVTLLPVPPNFSWLQIRDEPLMVYHAPGSSPRRSRTPQNG